MKIVCPFDANLKAKLNLTRKVTVEIMEFDLIQRGRFKTEKRSEIVGIDSLVSYDYMGSSEFEFGALGKSLRELLPRVGKLVITQVEGLYKGNAGLYQISLPSQVVEVADFLIRQASDEPQRLKEHMYLDSAIKGHKYYGDLSFWWDVDNNWMACFGKQNAENVVVALKLSREKRLKIEADAKKLPKEFRL